MTEPAEGNAAPESLDLGIVGNGQISALIDGEARIVWGCLPSHLGDPVFCRLVDTRDDGYFQVALVEGAPVAQGYVRNTAILQTRLRDRWDGEVLVTDFAPRFKQYGRDFRPGMLIRQVVPVRGMPRLRIRLRPRCDHGGDRPETTHDSNHIRYVTADQVFRLTTDVPVGYVLDESPFVLHEAITLVLGTDEPLPEAPYTVGRRYFEQTRDYWRSWVRSLAIPFEWQPAVIRSAITLKLSTYTETGAVIAATTTSIPEAAHSGRNWDYRYCWLRDAYFVVHALNRLGATRTMEDFLRFIIDLVVRDTDTPLQPVYGIHGESDLTEWQAQALAGYRGMGPVRVGNDAYRQVQHDVYGSVILATTQMFFDERLGQPGDEALFRRLEPLGERARDCYDRPDAGIWEYRGRVRVHTHSALMCWVACDRLRRIAESLGLAEDARRWGRTAAEMHDEICRRAFDPGKNSFVESFEGEDLDASLLLLHEMDFLEADDPRFVGTVDAVERELRRGDHVLRYAAEDDLGHPENAFNICTFWFIEALGAVGRHDEARRLFENMLAMRNPLGLLSEDTDPRTGELWGNFPQTYSMVGVINGAIRLSRSWESVI